MTPTGSDILELIRDQAPWLLEEQLGTCVVGSAALAEACRRAGIPGPDSADLDLAWDLGPEAGAALLREKGVAGTVTENSRARGTLALHLDSNRLEITSLRGEGETLRDRIRADQALRDMSIGAIAWWLGPDELIDDHGGLEDWRERRIAPVGDPAERIAEHPIRWLRYYRRAHELGFEVAPKIRKLAFDDDWAEVMPREQVAAEFRRALLNMRSPGRFFCELDEVGGLQILAPELAAQFDGRAAGPQRHHPEISQSLHLILVLEWAWAHSLSLDSDDRAMLMVAVLCHDLGKGSTPRGLLPAHHGHEHSGVPLVKRLLDSLPSLTGSSGRKLAEKVCELHLDARRLRQMRPGTVAGLYERHLRARDFRTDLFTLAIAADSGGRLGLEAEGERTLAQVSGDLVAVREACESVDVEELRRRFDDVEQFRAELHAARARALRAAGFGQ